MNGKYVYWAFSGRISYKVNIYTVDASIAEMSDNQDVVDLLCICSTSTLICRIYVMIHGHHDPK